MDDNEIGLVGALALAALLIYAIGELLWLTLGKKVSFRHEYSQLVKNLVFITAAVVLLKFATTASMAVVGQEFALFSLGEQWHFWLVALLIYEFWYWVQHFLAHKVRLLWCIHSPHHAPDSMNMLVGINHQLLEIPYLSFFTGFMPAICGVPLEMVVAINIIDVIWGNLLHISPRVIKGSYGPLEYFLQTPSYHRVHHAKNTRYMDTNYNSITLFWDTLLRTRQPLREDDPVEYGITREVNVESFRDVQFGEVALLWQDIKNTAGLKNKLSYLLMPPGWSHLGDQKMANPQKRSLPY